MVEASPTRAARAVLTVPRLAAWLGAAVLAACGGSNQTTGIDGSSSFSLTSCALGCAQAAPSGKIKCDGSQIKVNQEVWVEFTQPVDASSVDKNSFKVTNTLTGKTPSGSYTVSPNNPRRVIFKPLLSFDSNGNPTFGLDEGGNYEIDIPGTQTGSGPYIRSTSGQANSIGLQCFVLATGKSDPVLGPPSVKVFADPIGTEVADLTAPVGLDTTFRMEFDDLMNAATLVNPSTGESIFIEVVLDLDGNTADQSDQLAIPGTYTIVFDETVKTTTVTFTPEAGLPSAGSAGIRRVVIKLPPTITDVADNPLSNFGDFVVEPESVMQIIGSLEEDFVTDTLIDDTRTGADVSVVGGIGLVTASTGGGSGRLGDLLVSSGEVVTLVTDGTTIDGLDPPTFGPPQPVPPGLVDPSQPDEFEGFVLDNYDPDTELPGSKVIVVDDGVFEFSRVQVRGTLRFAGANAPRIFARGRFEIDGTIDVAGTAAAAWSSSFPSGGTPGAGGPAAGDGGQGGDRPFIGGTDLAALVGVPHNTGNPAFTADSSGNAPPSIVASCPGAGTMTFLPSQSVAANTFSCFDQTDMAPVIDGREAEGRGGQTPGADDFGAGKGGVHWPNTYPGPLKTNFGDLLLDSFCESDQVGAPGSGGSYATKGGDSNWVPLTILGTPPPPPPVTPGGTTLTPANSLLLDQDKVSGELIGGAGGGGGGSGIDETKTNGAPLNCGLAFIPPLAINTYFDHSGAGGGGGGGALQLQAGGLLQVDGLVRANGGQGGNNSGTSANLLYAAPGGGGSGGAILLQGKQITVTNVPGIIDVSGGKGGFNTLTMSRGGDGGAGVVHMEVGSLPALNFANEAAKIAPLSSNPALVETDVLRTGNWTKAAKGASARSGIQSCWLEPEGTIFNVDFDQDVDMNSDGVLDPTAGDSAAWDLGVYVPSFNPTAFVSLREANPILSSILGTTSSIQSFIGNDLGDPSQAPFMGAPIVVRFQGARAVTEVDDPCNVTFTQSDSPLLAGSLTPWVQHPAELTAYWDTVLPDDPGLAAKRRPNLIRYQILFDRNSSNASIIGGIGAVRIDFVAD